MAFNKEEIKHIVQVKHAIRDYVHKTMEPWSSWENGGSLQSLIKSHTVVSGGISASLLNNEPVKDIDLYTAGKISAEYLEKNFINSTGAYHRFVKDVNPKYMIGEVEGKCITANAITLIGDVQIIRLAEADVSRQLFDFIHCQPVYNWDKYSISEAQYASIVTKKLIKNPAVATVSAHRVDKFRQRGWDVSGISKNEIKI